MGIMVVPVSSVEIGIPEILNLSIDARDAKLIVQLPKQPSKTDEETCREETGQNCNLESKEIGISKHASKLIHGFHSISDSTDGFDGRWIGVPKFLAQALDVDVDNVCARVKVVIPNMFANLRPRKDPTRGSHQVGQQVKFSIR